MVIKRISLVQRTNLSVHIVTVVFFHFIVSKCRDGFTSLQTSYFTPKHSNCPLLFYALGLFTPFNRCHDTHTRKRSFYSSYFLLFHIMPLAPGQTDKDGYNLSDDSTRISEEFISVRIEAIFVDSSLCQA